MKLIKYLKKNENGSAALIGIFCLFALLPFIGIAIDAGNMLTTKTRMQNAVDAAIYGAALQFTNSSGTPDSTDQNNALTTVNDILSKNNFHVTLSIDTSNSFPPPANTINFATDTTNNTGNPALPEININVTQSFSTFFMGALGISSFSLSAGGEAVKTLSSTKNGGGWAILELGKNSSGTSTNGNISITGNVQVNGNVGNNGNGSVTLANSCRIIGNLWNNGNGNISLPGNAYVTQTLWDNGTGVFSMTGSSHVDGLAYSSTPNNDSFAWSTKIKGVLAQNGGANGFIHAGVLLTDASGAVSAVDPYAQAALTAYNNFITLSPTGATFYDTHDNNVTSTYTQATPVALNDLGYYNEPVAKITGGSGQNVVHLASLNITNDGKITLDGPSGASFVIIVDGTISVSGSGGIYLGNGGLIADNVTFVCKSTNTGSPDAVTVGNGVTFNGNILCPNGSISFTGNAAYNGTLVSGRNITLANSVHSPTNVTWLQPDSGGTTTTKVRLIH